MPKEFDSAAFMQQVHDDPVLFCRAIWEEMGYDVVAPIGKPEENMIHWIAGGDGVPSHRGCLAPRSIGKTHIGCAATLWRVFRNPDERVLITSKSEVEAKASLSMIRGWIDAIWFLKHLEPNQKIGHRDHALSLDVGPVEPRRRSPTFNVVGIGGQLAGKRASIILADDVETESNTMTFESRATLDKRVKELQRISSYGDREVIYIGTFQHEESVYIKLNDRGYIMRTWPILYPKPDEITDSGGNERILNLDPGIAAALENGDEQPGRRVFRHRHDKDYIKECQNEGMTGFYMHYMLIADLGDKARYPLKLRDLVCVDHIDRHKAPVSVMWGMKSSSVSTRLQDVPAYGFGDDGFYGPAKVDETWAPYLSTYMWIDPAGAGADLTGYACVGFLNGYLWVKDLGGLSGGFAPENLHRLAQIAYDNRVRKIGIEGNFGGGMLQPLLEPYLKRRFTEPKEPVNLAAPGQGRLHSADIDLDENGWACSCETFNSNAQKERRILDALEPVVQSHRVVIDRRIAENRAFQRQFTRITRQRDCLEHEDELEALAECCRMWVTHLSAAPEDLAKQQREDWVEIELEKMRSEGGIIASSSPVWFSHT
jgi:hypothetical protein